MTVWLRSLATLRLADAPLVGGKAAGLGELCRHGVAVPPGFAVLPDVLAAVLAGLGLADGFTAALAAARTEDYAPAEALAARLREAEWPVELRAAIATAAEALGARGLAVRSSATFEDGAASAAAGVFATRLDVPTDGVIAAINAVWADALTPGVFQHLLAMGQDPAAMRLPVVVQQMGRPAFAGVLFTQDPTDVDRSHLRIAVTEGGGEAVVQGSAGRDVRVPRVGEVLPDATPLSPEALTTLRREALLLESRFGRPLDLEFVVEASAVSDGPPARVFWVQARPIAGMPAGGRPPILWRRDMAEERFPEPISPLGWSALASALRVNLDTLARRFGLEARYPDEVATVHGCYVYNHATFFKFPGSLKPRLAPHLPFLGAYALGLCKWLAPSNLKNFAMTKAPRRGPLGSEVADPRFRAIALFFEAFAFAHAEDVKRAWARDFAGHMAAMEALDAEDLADKDLPALLDYTRRVIARSDAFMEPDLSIYVIKSACRWLVESITELVDEKPNLASLAVLTGGLHSNVTMTMNQALDSLFTTVAADSFLSAALRHDDQMALPGAWSGSFALPARDAFLKVYAHLTASWDIRVPTLGDQPGLLDALLAQRLRAPSHEPGVSPLAALEAAREQEVARLREALAAAPWAPAFFERLLATLHDFIRLDEEHHLFCGKLIPAERRIVAKLAAHFVATGMLAAADDIHFLSLDEVLGLARGERPYSHQRLAGRRRLAFERARARRPAAQVLGAFPLPEAAPEAPSSAAMQGAPAGPGIAEGTVRVVVTMADMAAFQPGEVLVATTPKPTFTPLFALAAAVVTTRGSTLSHGLIGAREYGLPAVTELVAAHERLVTGQRVRVDGTLGTVTPL